MTEKESKAAEKLMAEKLWLTFYNQVAFEKGFITEKERNQLQLKIENRRGSAVGG